MSTPTNTTTTTNTNTTSTLSITTNNLINLKCFHCLEDYNDPILLNCFHFCCRNCCLDLIQNHQNEIKCQHFINISNNNQQKKEVEEEIKCNQITKLTNEQLNKAMNYDWLFLLFLSKFNLSNNQNQNNETNGNEINNKKEEELICQNCEENKAISKCLDCIELLCEKCLDVHKMSKKTRTHKYEPLENNDIPTNIIIPKCQNHKLEHTHYCFDCFIVFCPQCFIDHKNHEFKFIKELFEEKQKEINDNFIPKLKEKQKEIELNLTEIYEKMEEISMESINLSNEYNDFFDLLQKLIEEKEMKYLKKIKDYGTNNIKLLDLNIHHFNHLIIKIKYFF